MREKLLHFPCVSRIHSTSERKNPPDFRREGAKCELNHPQLIYFYIIFIFHIYFFYFLVFDPCNQRFHQL
ncbi:hypothetical protein ETC03_08550 [Geobacillus sp. MMMUD3]|nr:hypothetical protein [Geobacillus sp. MMMUD3]